MNVEIFIIYLLCSYKRGKAALQKATQYLVFFGGGDLLCFDWLFFIVDGLSLASAFCIWISLMPHSITRSTSTGCQSLGFTTVELPMETCKTIAILDLEGSLALMLQYTQTHNTHPKSYMHTTIFSPSLHAVPHIQGTKVREHHLILNDTLFNLWHCLCSYTG